MSLAILEKGKEWWFRRCCGHRLIGRAVSGKVGGINLGIGIKLEIPAITTPHLLNRFLGKVLTIYARGRGQRKRPGEKKKNLIFQTDKYRSRQRNPPPAKWEIKKKGKKQSTCLYSCALLQIMKLNTNFLAAITPLFYSISSAYSYFDACQLITDADCNMKYPEGTHAVYAPPQWGVTSSSMYIISTLLKTNLCFQMTNSFFFFSY